MWRVSMLLIAVALVATAQADTAPIKGDELSRALGEPIRLRDPYALVARERGADISQGKVRQCAAESQTQVHENLIVQTRCRLVAFEVCVHRELGVISQSQDSRRQCDLVQTLAGPGACTEPCREAQRLPRGGEGSVKTWTRNYTGLTRFAELCFNENARGVTDGASCAAGEALQCLANASASPQTNQRIRDERLAHCQQWHRQHPDQVCSVCVADRLRVDYAPRPGAELSPEFCTPALAAKDYCRMP